MVFTKPLNNPGVLLRHDVDCSSNRLKLLRPVSRWPGSSRDSLLSESLNDGFTGSLRSIKHMLRLGRN